MATEPVQQTKGVDSARRVLQILLQFSDARPILSIDDLLNAHDISLPSAYRYISLLRELDLIEERGKGRYALSPKIIDLSRAAESSFDFQAIAQPLVDQLRDRTHESALFIRRMNDHAVCLATADSPHPIGLSFRQGTLMPLHGGASAKILLADLSRSRRERYLDRLEDQLSPEGRAALEQELDVIAERGEAESFSEVDAGVWAFAVQVEAHGTLIGALTVAAPAYRLNVAQREEIAAEVRATARQLEDRFEGSELLGSD